MYKSEWLSLDLYLQTISAKMLKLKDQEFSDWELLSELESELTSMKTMISLLLSQICCSPIEVRNQEVRS